MFSNLPGSENALYWQFVHEYMNNDIVGLIGFIVMIIGWIAQIVYTRETGNTTPLRLSVPYCIGAALLFAYSILIDNIIFIVLNAVAALMALVSIIQTIKSAKGSPK